MFMLKERYAFEDLLEIMRLLRSENGCPWDIEQTHESIEQNLLEETYEVIEAIRLNEPALLREELGDLLLQVVFHSQIEDEIGNFCFSDVADEIVKKLIYRHPHVFGKCAGARDNPPTSSEVLKNWERLKAESKGEKNTAHALRRIPKILPALMRGQKIIKKAGVDESEQQTLETLKAKLKALEKATTDKNSDKTEKALGEFLLSCCSLATQSKIDSEKALTKAIEKFIADRE